VPEYPVGAGVAEGAAAGYVGDVGVGCLTVVAYEAGGVSVTVAAGEADAGSVTVAAYDVGGASVT
jgi:hypothetical protein